MRLIGRKSEDDKQLKEMVWNYKNDELQSYLKNSGVNPDTTDKNGRTAMHMAAMVNNVKAIEYLKKAGASIDIQDKAGYTPMHVASSTGYVGIDAVNKLVELGADVLIKDKRGLTPVAAYGHDLKLRGETVSYQALEKLQETTDIANKKDVESKLNKNFDSKMNIALAGKTFCFTHIDTIDKKFEGGLTVLHIAVIEHRNDTVKELLEKYKANPNARDKEGFLPLHMAAISNNVDVMEELIKAGGNINAEDKEGRTALHMTAYAGADHVDALYRLVVLGADVLLKDKRGLTAYKACGHDLEMAGEPVSYKHLDKLKSYMEDAQKDTFQKIGSRNYENSPFMNK